MIIPMGILDTLRFLFFYFEVCLRCCGSRCCTFIHSGFFFLGFQFLMMSTRHDTRQRRAPVRETRSANKSAPHEIVPSTQIFAGQLSLRYLLPNGDVVINRATFRNVATCRQVSPPPAGVDAKPSWPWLMVRRSSFYCRCSDWESSFKRDSSTLDANDCDDCIWRYIPTMRYENHQITMYSSQHTGSIFSSTSPHDEIKHGGEGNPPTGSNMKEFDNGLFSPRSKNISWNGKRSHNKMRVGWRNLIAQDQVNKFHLNVLMQDFISFSVTDIDHHTNIQGYAFGYIVFQLTVVISPS